MTIAERYLGRHAGNKVKAAAELCLDLMRGDAATFKQGYTIGNALMAAINQMNLTTREVALVADAVVAKAGGSVILVETNGAEPENTTQLRGDGVEVINIDWDEVERGDDRTYITDILDRIEELGVVTTRPANHVGMPAVVAQLREALDRFDG